MIARDTAEQAWAAGATGCWRASARPDIAAVQAGLAPQRVRGAAPDAATCTAARRDGLEVSPNLWAGVGLVRGGAGTALVGSHTEVADRIAEYAALGITEFILSGHPHLEEAYWFGEGVLPILRRRGLWRHPAGGDDDSRTEIDVPFAGIAPRARP